MSKKILKFDNVEVNKEKCHACKQPIDLNLVNVYQILISDKFEPGDKGFKYFIGYKDDNIIRLLCIILPQMNGYIYIYIKYFDNGGKNMSFMIKDHSKSIKYNEIWNKIKKTLSMKNFTACVFIMKNK